MNQLEDLLQQCTVKLTLPDRTSWGTGFFVAPELILTCTHVVQSANGQPIQVRWQNQENWAQAVVDRSLPDPYDLALLKVTLPIDANPPCVYLDSAIQSRDQLYLFGYPDQDFPNGCPVTPNCEGLTGDEPALIKFALGQVRPGMSGSPLLNQRTGKVCGIVKFTRDRSIDLGGGAVPAAVILEQFPELVEQQRSFHQKDKRWWQQIQALSESIPADLRRSGVVEFVGRAETMIQLHERLQQDDRVAVSAIVGMGGIGKTELALQYALAYRQTYTGGLCWLQARSGDVGTQLVSFGQSCLDLNPPDGLELADQVKYCWRNWKVGEVLLVFDDVINYGAIKPYLPPSTEPRFKVLITTRLRLGRSVNELPLNVLDEAAALALLQSLVKGDRIAAELDQAKLLCEQLGYLPLGLDLVGRYVYRKPDLSLAEMRQRLEGQRLEARALCRTDRDADMTAELGVAASFQLSWETLSEEAKQLGCRLSLFAAAPIPWSLVKKCWVDRDPENLEEIRDDKLLNLHLLQQDTNTYHLHPLIREFFRAQLDQFQESHVWKQQFCRVMIGIAQQVNESLTLEDINKRAPSMPHLVEIVENKTIFENNTLLSEQDFCLPFVGLGRFYTARGAYQEAKSWYKKYLSSAIDRFGENSLEVAASQNNLADTYKYLSSYEDAEELYKKALDLSLNLLGENHLDTAAVMNNLALLYSFQGSKNDIRYSPFNRLLEARKLFRKSLKIRSFHLGANHLTVAQSLNNLGMLYVNLGLLYVELGRSRHSYSIFYQKAERLLNQAFEIRKTTLKYHPDIAEVQNNLAYLYTTQGRYSEAEHLYFESLKLNKKLLGIEHPNYARSLWNLGGLYVVQKRDETAKPLWLDAINILEDCLGSEHTDVIDAKNSLKLFISNSREMG